MTYFYRRSVPVNVLAVKHSRVNFKKEIKKKKKKKKKKQNRTRHADIYALKLWQYFTSSHSCRSLLNIPKSYFSKLQATLQLYYLVVVGVGQYQ